MVCKLCGNSFKLDLVISDEILSEVKNISEIDFNNLCPKCKIDLLQHNIDKDILYLKEEL